MLKCGITRTMGSAGKGVLKAGHTGVIEVYIEHNYTLTTL